MPPIDPRWLEYRRKYFIRLNGNIKPRANAHLSIRHDAYRFMPPGAPRHVGKDVVRYFWPDHGRTEQTDGREDIGPAEAAADLAALLSLKRELDVIRAELKFRRVYAEIMGRLRALRDGEVSKAFNPNQPRVPAGSREGGQWTGDGSGGVGINDSRVISDATPVDELKPGARYAALKRPGGRNNTPLNPPPEIPQQRPPTIQERNLIAKLLARSSIAIEVLAAGPKWLYDHLATMQAYRDPPKTLAELQEAVADKTTAGYQDHHIVGQVARKEEGRNFPEWWIDRPENIVRIPTLKHREINGWYSEHNDAKPFNGLSPRDYLRGKDWSERYRIGLEALIEHRVLKP
jgi:hypothetical protein